jgi:hypothetical protein
MKKSDYVNWLARVSAIVNPTKTEVEWKKVYNAMSLDALRAEYKSRGC